MPNQLSVKRLGWSVSAVLAVPYVLIVLACVLLVGFLTTRSWQADFLGLEWNTIIGFELGFAGIAVIGFGIALALVPAYNFARQSPRSETGQPSAQPWATRLFTACLVLPALILVVLRALAGLLSSDVGEARAQVPGVLSQPVNIGRAINTAYREAEPSFTADGRTMYYNCHNGDICVSHLVGTWEQGDWTPPERLGAPISTEYEEIEPVINGAGDELYFTSIRPAGALKNIPFLSPFVDVLEVTNRLATANADQSFFGGVGLDDVWVSFKINGAWSQPQNINDVPGEPHINTLFADHCLFFSADGNEAFWTSTRPGGLGSDDIWTSRRVDGQWTPPENLGPNVNGSRTEHTSIPTPDGRSLYVTSDRPGGFGGEDIYLTSRDVDGKWGPLVNLGSLVNGSGDDRCPAWTPDLKFFLFDSVRQAGYGGRDIWWIYFEDVPGHPIGATLGFKPGNWRVATPHRVLNH